MWWRRQQFYWRRYWPAWPIGLFGGAGAPIAFTFFGLWGFLVWLLVVAAVALLLRRAMTPKDRIR